MKHWSEGKEIGNNWKIFLSIAVYKIFGRSLMIIYLIFPVSFMYFIYCFISGRIKASRDFLKRISKYNKKVKSNIFHSYKHLLSFIISICEKYAAWNGDIPLKDLILQTKENYNKVIDLLKSKKGMIILFAHIGNIELLRALAVISEGNPIKNCKINIIIDFKLNKNINILMAFAKNNKNNFVNFIDASNIGADTIIAMESKLNKGEIIAIAGDRTSSKSDKFNIVNFLGEEAYFPYGAFLIPVLLKYPTYYFFALREKDKIIPKRYDFYIYESKIISNIQNKKLTKDNKNRISLELTKEFVKIIEEMVIKYPYQWYNMYYFWNKEN